MDAKTTDNDDFEMEDEEAAAIDDAVSDLLDCVERPVGTLAPVIPDTPASRRAILALFDAVGRTL